MFFLDAFTDIYKYIGLMNFVKNLMYTGNN